jgi:antirestriction protein ArdC
MKRDLYAEVSARIVAELERSAAPWIKPWSVTAGANIPCNAVSNRPYSGFNVVLLWMAQAAGYRAPRFLTFKQALELGGIVRKGEHGTKIYFVKQLQVRDRRADDTSRTPRSATTSAPAATTIRTLAPSAPAPRAIEAASMSNPLRHVEEAKKLVEHRNRARENYQLEHRGALAAEHISDELALMRAEMSAIRELLATIAAKPTR